MKVNVENCTGCGYCLLSCPQDAISSDGWARVDEERCNDCNICYFVCPNRCLVPVSPIELPKAGYRDRYDVVVVGAGIGGLMAAAWLAKQGRKVGIFERLSFVGGRYTELDYRGYAVTTAAWTSLGEKCNIGRFLKDVGADVQYITLKEKGATHQSWIWFKDGRHYASLDEMLSRQEMRGFLRALIEGRRGAPHNVSTTEYVGRYVQNEDLMAVINAIVGTASGVSADDFPASEYIQITMDMRAAGLEFGFPVGGVRAIIEALAKVVKAHDGEIFTRTEVASFLVENGQARRVVLANGDEVAAEVVIHNGGARGLINLLGRENLPPDYVERIEGLIPVDCAAIILGTTEPLWEGVPMLMTPGTDRVFGLMAPTFFDPSIAPPGRHMVDVFLPVLSQDRQAELELALADLRALFPRLDEVTEMVVPMFFTGSWTGAGCAQTFGQVGDMRLHPRTPIEGLYLVGMDAVGSGAAGDLIPIGVRRLLEVVKRET
jgi:phytoene dehydrogenase-like protein/NAD-dependent dihydropyrimidine dehydrogenase PreA subunit